MTSIGASAPLDYLIESVLFPNKTIKEGYHSVQIQTKDDQEYSGIFVKETDQEIILRDAANKEVSVPKNNVASRKTGASLMPSGLVDGLSEDERADLFRFLSELGKPGPFDASKGNVARVWRLFVLNAHQEQFGTDQLNAGDLSVTGWLPTFATVDGKISRHDMLTQIGERKREALVGLLALARLQVASDAKVRLKISGAEKPQLWVDGKLMAVNSDVEVSLAQGKHAIVLRLDTRKLPEHIRLETSEGTFLTE